MKVIVLLIVAITICSCGIKPKVSCTVATIENVMQECKENPQFGISKSF